MITLEIVAMTKWISYSAMSLGDLDSQCSSGKGSRWQRHLPPELWGEAPTGVALGHQRQRDD